ncbi:hypothetical protein SAMN04487941_0121 [Pontibacter akesuensis]|uniref:Uncharacterized protein n=1 Tax=Pontibacter akesuensis TaxID=388950 RepID=A0A1I7KYN1_9BACT|nr:hypothetical protein SAMN04487941_0121 [Pontibacter akesuensis]
MAILIFYVCLYNLLYIKFVFEKLYKKSCEILKENFNRIFIKQYLSIYMVCYQYVSNYWCIIKMQLMFSF